MRRNIIIELNGVRLDVTYYKDHSWDGWIIEEVNPLEDNIVDLLSDDQYKELQEAVSSKEFNFK